MVELFGVVLAGSVVTGAALALAIGAFDLTTRVLGISVR